MPAVEVSTPCPLLPPPNREKKAFSSEATAIGKNKSDSTPYLSFCIILLLVFESGMLRRD